MNRRSFVGALGALGAAGAAAGAAPARTRYYELERFILKAGTQLSRLHDAFSKSFVPKLNEIWSGPKIFLEALVAPHMPQFAVIYGFASFEELETVRQKMRADADVRKALEALASGPEPAFESMDDSILEAAPYSPEIAPAAADKPARIFELRVYHSPGYRELMALHQRFAGSEVSIFHRSGIHPVFYSSGLFGPNLPNLTYLIPFDSLAEREKAWAAFGADPEWIKVRKESVDKYGQITSVQDISLWKAAPYSPVR